MSLWDSCHAEAKERPDCNLSEIFSGIDGFMREANRIGTLFEEWACRHIEFDELTDVWPYILHDRFGGTCRAVRPVEELSMFSEIDCLYVALSLRLPLRDSPKLIIAVDLRAVNTVKDSGFPFFLIRSVRCSRLTEEVVRFSKDDDPADGDHGQPFYSLYGDRLDGLAEHIADRDSLAGILRLAEALAPGLEFRAAARLQPSLVAADC